MTLNRRTFLKTAAAFGAAIPAFGKTTPRTIEGKKVGIIGLDTSHSIAFAKTLNAENPKPEYMGYKVVAAYPYGSKDIESSTKRIAGYTEEVKKLNVSIENSIADLLAKVDVILLETNDGRPHLEQALQVMKAGKTLFIDKPVAGSLSDAIKIYEAAKQYNVPVFSASSLRYIKGVEGLDKTQVLGADTFSPATLEKTHPDLFWYGIHGVETLFTVMGRGCKSVTRTTTPNTDIVVGIWADGRIGTFRGTRTGAHGYGGTVFTSKGSITLGPYNGYDPLLKEIIQFFDTRIAPVTPEETLDIYAFMEAADESKRQNGATVNLIDVLKKAKE
jgi:hypothetical protein